MLAETFFLIAALLIAAYVALRVLDARTLYDRSAFPELFDGLERMKLSGKFMIVIRFIDVRYWFILAREHRDNCSSMYICIPRVGFVDEDYLKLEKKFSANSFEFQREPEMSRFYAKIPIEPRDETTKSSIRAAHAARLFMDALNLDPAAKFRKGHEAG